MYTFLKQFAIEIVIATFFVLSSYILFFTILLDFISGGILYVITLPFGKKLYHYELCCFIALAGLLAFLYVRTKLVFLGILCFLFSFLFFNSIFIFLPVNYMFMQLCLKPVSFILVAYILLHLKEEINK